MDASALFEIVTWAAGVGTIFVWFATGTGLLAFASSWLLRKGVFRMERAAHRSDAASYASFILLPMASVLSAVIAGIGVNLVTPDEGQDDNSVGWLMILAAILIVIYAGYAGLNPRTSYRFGVVRLRRRIASLEHTLGSASSLSSAERDALVAQLRRMLNVGQQISVCAQRHAIREQFRRRWTRLFLILAIVSSVAALVAVLFAFGMAIAAGPGLDERILFWASVPVLSPVCPLLIRTYERWWLNELGQEIVRDATRLLRSLAGIPPTTWRTKLQRAVQLLLDSA